MSERKLRETETNRQLLASSRRVKKLYQFFAVIIATAFISSAVTLTISADGPTGFGTVIEPGSMVADANYIIFKDASTYYAKNGTTGAIDYSGTNASQIIQTTIDSMPNGTMLKLRNGIYEIDTRITVSKPIILEGEGAIWGAGGDYATGTVLKAMTLGMDVCWIEYTADYSDSQGTVLRDFAIDGATIARYCLTIFCAWPGGPYISKCSFHDMLFCRASNTGFGVYDHADHGSAYYSCRFIGNAPSAPLYGGLLLSTNAASFYQCAFELNGIGINVWSGVGHKFYSCIIEGNKYDGVRGPNPAVTTYLQNVHFAECHFEYNSIAGVAGYYDINMVTQYCSGWSIVRCHFNSPLADGSIHLMGRNHTISDCSAFGGSIHYLSYGGSISGTDGDSFNASSFPLSSNTTVSGPGLDAYSQVTITGAVNVVLVTHGLVSTPTYVSITGNNTLIGNSTVTVLTSTTFTISFENQPGSDVWLFYWYAKV